MYVCMYVCVYIYIYICITSVTKYLSTATRPRHEDRAPIRKQTSTGDLWRG